MPKHAKHMVGKTTRDRFWAKVDKKDPKQCWPWLAGKDARGYGRFRSDEGPTYAHKYAIEEKLGRKLAHNEETRHTCDNPPCCNPAHLVPGSTQDNIDDMMSRGRHNPGRGERQRSAVLTEKIVLIIRKSKKSNAELANQYGVKPHTISNVKTGKTWRHV